LQRIFGLTQIESDVICRIARGEAPRAIAATTGRSYETIRTHLKSIYGKTGVSSQSELVQLVVAVAEP
jgi:DNA-binding CsgD family transcriptional regulator